MARLPEIPQQQLLQVGETQQGAAGEIITMMAIRMYLFVMPGGRKTNCLKITETEHLLKFFQAPL